MRVCTKSPSCQCCTLLSASLQIYCGPEEGFSDTTEDNVKEHTEEHRGTLTNEELEDLLKSFADDDDD